MKGDHNGTDFESLRKVAMIKSEEINKVVEGIVIEFNANKPRSSFEKIKVECKSQLVKKFPKSPDVADAHYDDDEDLIFPGIPSWVPIWMWYELMSYGCTVEEATEVAGRWCLLEDRSQFRGRSPLPQRAAGIARKNC